MFTYSVQLSGSTPLLRQYFPKGSSLAEFTQTELDVISAKLNKRPRKSLGYDTPADRLALLLH